MLFRSSTYGPRGVLAAARAIRETEADLVHSHGHFAGVVGRAAAWWTGRAVAVHHLHTVDPTLEPKHLRRERFLLRLYVLGLGYRIITRSLSGSSAGVKNDVGDVWAWDIFDRATADWSTLEKEHVETFRVFVLSLTAEKRTLESGA